MVAVGRVAVLAGAAADHAAFEEIYREHAAATFGLLTRLVGPSRDREDLLQETFIRLHPALGRFRGECAVRTLVFRIATRVVVDHLRRRRRAPLDTFAELDLENELDPAATVEQQAARREEVATALAVLGQLKPKLRVAFVLREVMDLSYEEAAAIVEASPDAVRMRVNAAKRAIDALAAKEARR